MYLNRLQLRHFRNYDQQIVEFATPKTIIVGNNAQGKSNLLESVQLLATLKSYRVSRDRDLVQNNAAIAEINASCDRVFAPIELDLKLRSSGRRSLSVNGVRVGRQVEFLGQLNAVAFSSLDLDLVRGGPENRRNWLDSVLVQLEPIYASILQQYNQVLKQRNALLKSMRQRNQQHQQNQQKHAEQWQSPKYSVAEPDRVDKFDKFDQNDRPATQPKADPQQMALWDAQLAIAGSRLARRRSRLIERLAPIAKKWHHSISGGSEVLELVYAPKLDQAVDFNQENAAEAIQTALLAQIKHKAIAELQQGRSLVGPHRDEVNLLINQTPAREYGSQGQQRTLVLALKLAELELIETIIGEPPLLLLDDVLAELDLTRQDRLLNAIADRVQTIITTTHLGSFDAQWLQDSQVLQVEQGRVFS
ncbi:DNA replication and repair protein recF [Thalassoporum mexicanum PCC 7367]|uniref:DNA replication/repair protein RecF n=1 Tax=Thalassoporum mexicanum TaxID=3457544 RepID=UPI00029F99B5|nr:DNA replication/repair protein RecF [Pseudanabaena sp. PCC 7367]AFY70136.1 DNA replication and repair protein recF [Pseudanabaena sp. PCC 7367]